MKIKILSILLIISFVFNVLNIFDKPGFYLSKKIDWNYFSVSDYGGYGDVDVRGFF